MINWRFWNIASADPVFRPAFLLIYLLFLMVAICACSTEPDSTSKQTEPAMGDVAVSTHVTQSPRPASTARTSSLPNRVQNSAQTPEELLDEISWVLLGNQAPNEQRAVELFRLLEQSGYAGLLAIKDYLLNSPALDQKTEDEQTLRLALLEFLLSSSQPGLEGIVLDLLVSEPGVLEVALLGRFLESNYPGQHTQVIRSAAEQALRTTDSYSDIPGSLFQLLGETGDSESIDLLLGMPMHRDAYVSVALSLLPDGSGISLLEADARLFERGEFTTHGRLAIELLAQQAHQYPVASKVLIDLARKNLIPADIWPQLVTLLAGSQGITLTPPAGNQATWNTIYRTQGNQSLYLATRSPQFDTPEQINQRLYVLAQLQYLAPQEFMRQLTAAQTLLTQLKQGPPAVSINNNPGVTLHGFALPERQRIGVRVPS